MARRTRRVRNPETARIDPAMVDGLRLWVKRTFVPKPHYASASKAVDHLRHLRDVEARNGGATDSAGGRALRSTTVVPDAHYAARPQRVAEHSVEWAMG